MIGLGQARRAQVPPRIEYPNMLSAAQASFEVANPGGVAGWGFNRVTPTNSTDWFSTGTQSLKLTPTGTDASDSYINLGGDTGGMKLGMVAGNVYTVVCDINIPVAIAQPPALDSRALGICFYHKATATGTGYISSQAQATNVAGVTRLRLTKTLPADTTEAFIRLYHGSQSGSGVVYYDRVGLFRGTPPADWWIAPVA